jgi:hypothetical protein
MVRSMSSAEGVRFAWRQSVLRRGAGGGPILAGRAGQAKTAGRLDTDTADRE